MSSRRSPSAGPPGFDEWIDLYVHPADRGWVAELHRRASETWTPVIDATFRVADDAGPAGSAMRLRREVSTLRAQVRNADRALATANERIASLESCLREALYNLRELVKEL